MAEIILLRHSMTRGNLEGRYIGCRTDEPLCEEGIRLLADRIYPAVDRIYTSPMRRCIETAQAIWGDSLSAACRRSGARTSEDGQDPCSGIRQIPIVPVPALRECDFGEFENKNYQELNGNPAYQAWIDSVS